MPRLRVHFLVVLAVLALLCLMIVQAEGGGSLIKVPGSSGKIVSPAGVNADGGRVWALVIGVNYDKEPPEFSLGRLENAENDARRIYDTLLEEFGYVRDQTFLLLGSGTGEKQASKANLDKYLRGVLGPDGGPRKTSDGQDLPEVGERDSVLVFFAGHGSYRTELAQTENYMGEIIPAGARLTADGKPAPDAVCELAHIKEALARCKARSKLLVLDCCHSGQLFNLPFKQSILVLGPASDEHSRKEKKAFWGVTSCRSWEKAADRSKTSRDNSPFTSALIRQLRNLSGFNGTKPAFTARQLFERIQNDFYTEGIQAQRPVAGPLSEDGGDFFFYPRLTPRGLEMRRQEMQAPGLLASTLPGAHGTWWFDDTPWLIPSLRAAILDFLKERSTGLDSIQKRSLQLAAKAYCEAYHTGKSELEQRRRKQLERLLTLQRASDRMAVLEELANELEGSEDSRAGKPALAWTAADLHLLAVLRHRLEKHTGLETVARTADEYYLRAHKKYEEETRAAQETSEGRTPDPNAMHALCLADWGHYEMMRYNFEQAREHFSDARSIFSPEKRPLQFEVYLLCREAEAYRSLGNFEAARKSLERAVETAERLQKDGPMVAFTLEYSGWTCMASWQVEQAADHFSRARDIRSRFSNDMDSVILELHNAHGLAMTHRFRGKHDQAIKDYADLLKRIRDTIQRFEKEGAQYTNYVAMRDRLYERLANTTERLADSFLLADQPDFAEAARFYGQVLSLRHRLPTDQAEFTRLRIVYKLALCQSLSRDERDQAEARALLLRTERDLKAAKQGKWISKEQEEMLLLIRLISSSLVALAELEVLQKAGSSAGKSPEEPAPGGKGLAEGREPLVGDIFRALALESLPGMEKDERLRDVSWEDLVQKWIDTRLNNRKLRIRLQRDDVELLLLAVRLLVQKQREKAEVDPPALHTRHPADRAATLLIKLVHLVQEMSPRETLAYLRPTYNLIITTRLESRRSNVKSLLDLIHSARTGHPYTEVITRPTLVFYFFEPDHGVALLDVPHGISRAYAVTDDPQEALRFKRPLRLPTALVRELQALQGDADLLWEDSVTGLGPAYRAVFDFSPQFKALTFHHRTDQPGDQGKGTTARVTGKE